MITSILLLMLGFVLAGLIARYNESNKLFWILFTSYVVGIAGGSMYSKYVHHDDNDESTTIVTPTPEFTLADTIQFVTAAEEDTLSTKPNQVSKDTIVINDSSSVSCSPKEGNKRIVTNPVKPKVCTNISTQVDN